MGVTVPTRCLDVIVQIEKHDRQVDLARLLTRYLRLRAVPAGILEAPSLAVALGFDGTHAVLDASASLEPFLAWLSSPSRDVDLGGRQLRLHVLVAGTGPALLACVGALRTVSAPLDSPAVVVWMDLSVGPLQSDGRHFEDTRVFREVRSKALGELRVLPGDLSRLEDSVFGQLDVLLGPCAKVPKPVLPRHPAEKRHSESPPEPQPPSILGLEALTTRLLEKAEERMAARMSSLAQHWSSVMREAASEAALLIADRTNESFGARAEHFTARIEAVEAGDLQRRAADARASRDALTAVLREWVEPRVGWRGRWVALGAMSCFASAVLGVVTGIALSPAFSP